MRTPKPLEEDGHWCRSKELVDEVVFFARERSEELVEVQKEKDRSLICDSLWGILVLGVRVLWGGHWELL